MVCPVCGTSMINSIGGNYRCPSCGHAVNDLVYRGYTGDTIAKPQSPYIKDNNVQGEFGPMNNKPIPLYGWVCPLCNRVNAPFVHHCACSTPVPNTITFGIAHGANADHLETQPIQDSVNSTVTTLSDGIKLEKSNYDSNDYMTKC